MTKYLIQDTTLTSIADEIRTLSGTEETLSPEAMKEKVAEGNENITIQADLIAQIQTALQNKASGSGENSESEYYSSGIIECSSASHSITIPSSGPIGGLSLTYLNNNISTYIVTGQASRYIYSLYVGPDFKGYVAIPCQDGNNANIGLETDTLTYDSTSGLVSISGLMQDNFAPGIYVYVVW